MGDELWGTEVQRAELSRAVFEGLGWDRFVPHVAVEVLGVVVLLGAPTRDQVGRLVGRSSDAAAGLAAPAWESWEAGDAGLRWLADLRRDVDRYARALGVAAPDSVAGTLDYLVACSLLVERDGRFRLNPGARLPAEVLPLSRARVAEEDAGRWLDLYRPVVRRLAGLFGATGDDPLDEVRMTLHGLADILELDVETVRAAVVILGDQPDFTVLDEVECAWPHDEVRIRVNGPARLNPLEPT